MQPITAWYKYNHDSKEWEFNHIEDEHVTDDYPLPLQKQYTNQKSWSKSKWIKTFAYLSNHKIVNRGNE